MARIVPSAASSARTTSSCSEMLTGSAVSCTGEASGGGAQERSVLGPPLHAVAEPRDVVPAAVFAGLADDGGAGGADDLDEGVGVDLALA